MKCIYDKLLIWQGTHLITEGKGENIIDSIHWELRVKSVAEGNISLRDLICISLNVPV